MNLASKTDVEAFEIKSAKTFQTLGQLVEALDAFRKHAPVFRSNKGNLDGEHHITELKHASINSMDCGGRPDQWIETIVQLLDGTLVSTWKSANSSQSRAKAKIHYLI